MEIVKSLSLNKHPKTVPNLSLVNAENIKISNDGTSIINEEEIILNDELHQGIINVSGGYTKYTIRGVIPCNNELILFIHAVHPSPTFVDIYRYNENTTQENKVKLMYKNLPYYGGEIKGTFTYSAENSLIIAFSEYNATKNVPLRTLNLGNFEDESILSDINLSEDKLSLVPKVKIPTILDYNYLVGSAYKGWYYCFIRYKINEHNYTQWYNFGCPIYLDNLIVKNLYKEHYFTKEQLIHRNNSYIYGFSDAFSDKSDICNKTFKIICNNLDIDYSHYQIGFICSTKSYNKSWRTSDIDINIDSYVLNANNLIEESILELTTKYHNYFDVKNLINYNNKLYISNYKEVEYYDVNELIAYSRKIKLNGKFTAMDDTFVDSIKDLPDLNKFNFDNRCKNTTLIPDGIYNFYIHFIDKYGNETKGFKLDYYKYDYIYQISQNNITDEDIVTDGIDRYGIIEKFSENPDDVTSQNYYYPMPFDMTLKELKELFGKDAIICYKDFYNGVLLSPIEISSDTFKNLVLSFYENKCNDLFNEKYEHLYISQIFNNAKFTGINTFKFGITANSNGELLYRVPKDVTYTNIPSYNRYTIEIENDNEEIPNGYIGYYISYEEYETNNLATGLLVKRTANIGGNDRIVDKNAKPDKDDINSIYFYSSIFDINDKLNLNINAININGWYNESKDKYLLKADLDIETEVTTHGNIYYDLHTDEIPGSVPEILFGIDYKLCIANDIQTNRFGKGTALLLRNNIKNVEFFTNQLEDDAKNIESYVISLYNYNNEIYTKNNKKLIRLSDIIYNNDNTYINHGYNGKLTYDGIVIYNDNGFVLADVYDKEDIENSDTYNTKNINKSITAITKVSYLKDIQGYVQNELKGDSSIPIVYVKIPIYSDICFESKVINNDPIIKYTNIEPINSEHTIKSAPSQFIEPINSIDLFKNPQGAVTDFYPMTNTNYIKSDLDITEFNKTIRRSFIIQEETRVNNWRKFAVEDYKIITENKGNITNLIGIGNTFLIHTEHSLFQYKNDNKLEMGNQELQIDQQDIFDLQYQELYTSDLGFGGLKNNKEGICDSFGYIFYDNDGKTFYKLDNGRLERIDVTITDYINNVDIKTVRFAHDKNNDRILIKLINNNEQSIILSYNYLLKQFISFHTYNFSDAYSTKNNLYFINDVKSNIYSFNKDKFNTSKLSIIINEAYEFIKYLEQISYNLKKHTINNNLIYNPLNDNITPFSGNTLKVYNDLTNTGELNIEVNEEVSKNIFANFDKPYWYLGNWHYNYFRNNIKNGVNNSDNLSRIVGNYFIIEFKFNPSNDIIRFDDLTYKITK